jgi:BirA family biotin operon repressor/biotin-[acetyl-CoA-carboxylase] ligase
MAVKSMHRIRIETVDSTNRWLEDWVAHHAPELPEEGTLVAAEEQTAGRGQAGTAWEAAPGKNITCSIWLRPSFLPLERRFLLSEAMALGVKEALEAAAVELGPFSVKWPNDVYYGERKIAGILIENRLTGRQIEQSIVGIGLNVNQEAFTSDAPNPISLKQLLGRSVARDELLEILHGSLLQWYGRLQAGAYESTATAYRDALYRLNGFHAYRDRQGTFRAAIRSVSDEGFLHLTTEAGEARRYAFKEVSFAGADVG